jgi:hypothetical protein
MVIVSSETINDDSISDMETSLFTHYESHREKYTQGLFHFDDNHFIPLVKEFLEGVTDFLIKIRKQ